MKLHAHPVHATPLPVRSPLYRIAEAVVFAAGLLVIGYVFLVWLP